MYIVAWQQKPASASEWTYVWAIHASQAAAMDHYNSLLPGPHGSWGPIEYRNITYGRVLSQHSG